MFAGGRIHPTQMPSPDKSLRWKVGHFREDYSAANRSKIPNKSFMSNNFLVKKDLFDKVKFNDAIERSGHEDTIYGIELEKKNIIIKHINNAVVHLGLESNDEFITKSEQRLDTLLYLMKYYSSDNLMIKRIKVLKIYHLTKVFKLTSILSTIFKALKPKLVKQLKSINPNL